MADRRIEDFATLADAKDGDLLLVSSNAETYNIKVKTIKEAVQSAADLAAHYAEEAAESVKEAIPITSVKIAHAVTNLLDLSKCTPQCIEADGLGTILDDSDYVLTDYIPCIPSEKYYCPAGNRRRCVWFDKNKTFIKYEGYGSYSAPGTITAPKGAAFFRMSYGVTPYDGVAGWDNKRSMIVYGGDGYPTEYIPCGNAIVPWLRGDIGNNAVTTDKISNGAITFDKMSGVIYNLLDLSKCTKQMINISEDENIQGTISDSEDFILTDIMPCIPNQIIWCPAGNRRRGNFYDEFGSRIKTELFGSYALPGKIVIPDNAYYFRLNYGMESYDGIDGWDNEHAMIICGGNGYPSDYIPYGEAAVNWLHIPPVKDDSVTANKLAAKAVTADKLDESAVKTEHIVSHAITPEKISGTVTNKLNLDDITAGKLSPDNGTVIADSGYMVSAYIDIAAGQAFVCPQGQDRCICYYDEQKQYLSSDTVTGWQDGIYTGTMPENAAYLRVSYKLEGFAVWPMLCLGTTYPDKYVPYGDTVTWLDRNPLKGRKLAVLGDSLSAWYKSAISNAGYFNGMDYDRAVHNQSVWGSPIARHNIEGTPASFVERFSLLRDTTDYLVIQGGVNDCGLNIPIGLITAWDDFTGALNEYTFIGALESLFRQAQAKYPNAKILFFTSAKLLHMPKLGDYMDAAKLVCNKYSIPVLDLYNCSGLNQGIPAVKSKYFSDDTHPNDWGHLLLTKTVERFLIDCFAPAQINTSDSGGIYSWTDVQNAVRRGMAPILFPVGYEFTTHDSDTGTEIVWAVRGHNHHAAADSKIKHTMTLETKNLYSTATKTCKTIQFDAPQALYYAPDGLAAGTYHFEVANQVWCPSDNGKTYQFTLANAVPAGGQIAVGASLTSTAFADKTIKTYASPSSVTEIESATLAEGAEGTRLGTTDGNSANINHMHRVLLGSNNYAQSAVRQWLNSAAEGGGVWSPQTKYDRPPVWAEIYYGFLHSLPADFLAVIQTAVIPCRTSSTYECGSLDGTVFVPNQTYTLQDKFFILSRPEIYGTWDNTDCKDGEQLEYYTGLLDAERKKYDSSGTVRTAWLRSPTVSYASHARVASTDGSINGYGVSGSYGVAPACIIG